MKGTVTIDLQDYERLKDALQFEKRYKEKVEELKECVEREELPPAYGKTVHFKYDYERIKRIVLLL